MDESVAIGYIEKAVKSLHVAEICLKGKEYEDVISNAYYAMFFTAEALLYCDGMEYKDHKGVISNFGKEYSKTNKVEKGLHTDFINLFNERNRVDYQLKTEITEQYASESLGKSVLFVKYIAVYINESKLKNPKVEQIIKGRTIRGIEYYGAKYIK